MFTQNQFNHTVAELNRRAAKILPDIAAGALERDQKRILPVKEIRMIADAGLLVHRLPTAWGGAGASVVDVIRFVMDLAQADPSVAQALRAHVVIIESFLLPGREADAERWFPIIRDGAVISAAGWEIGGKSGAISANLKKEGDHFVANGRKYYSTGALYADWVGVNLVNEAGRLVHCILPRDREGLELVDDFDGVGQRLSASGTTVLNNVKVQADEVREIPAGGAPAIVPSFAQLYLAAIEAGIACNAVTDAVDFVRRKARPIAHSSAERSTDDPYVRQAVGEVRTRAFQAEAAVLLAAATVDAAWDNGLTEESVVRASIDIAQAQYIAIEAALRAAELVFDVAGGSAVAAKHGLDRHWRNARTVANHNPRQWKLSVIGDNTLNGAPPPANGLF